MGMNVEVILERVTELGEGPFWDEQRQTLYFVDITGKKMHRYSPNEKNNDTFPVDQMIGAVVPAEAGKLVCAMEQGFYAFDLQTQQLSPLGDPESQLPNNRFNDGKCDAAGRFWAGTMSKIDERHQGSLYCLRPDGSWEQKVKDVSISNGLAWSPDHKTMYYIDSPTRQVKAFNYNIDDGAIDAGRVLITFPEDAGLPDGMTIDVEGYLWIAMWGGWGVLRCDPQSGQVVQKIELPVSRVTSCAFGGKDMDVLYITSASIGLAAEQLQKEPLAGSLFQLKTMTKGFHVDRYGHNG
jgi:sugar lactone lactonase YvrE